MRNMRGSWRLLENLVKIGTKFTDMLALGQVRKLDLMPRNTSISFRKRKVAREAKEALGGTRILDLSKMRLHQTIKNWRIFPLNQSLILIFQAVSQFKALHFYNNNSH